MDKITRRLNKKVCDCFKYQKITTLTTKNKRGDEKRLLFYAQSTSQNVAAEAKCQWC